MTRYGAACRCGLLHLGDRASSILIYASLGHEDAKGFLCEWEQRAGSRVGRKGHCLLGIDCVSLCAACKVVRGEA